MNTWLNAWDDTGFNGPMYTWLNMELMMVNLWRMNECINERMIDLINEWTNE